jgi:uncharacterized protein YndB with AHSA1/START domain
VLKKSIVIDAPISLVWQHLTCPKLMTAWMPGIRAMRSADGGKARLGGILVFTVRAGERESEIIAFDPGRAFALRAIDGAFTALYRYELAPAPDGIEVSLHATCTARGLALLAGPLVRSFMRKADRWQLAYLKGEVEKARDLEARG